MTCDEYCVDELCRNQHYCSEERHKCGNATADEIIEVKPSNNICYNETLTQPNNLIRPNTLCEYHENTQSDKVIDADQQSNFFIDVCGLDEISARNDQNCPILTNMTKESACINQDELASTMDKIILLSGQVNKMADEVKNANKKRRLDGCARCRDFPGLEKKNPTKSCQNNNNSERKTKTKPVNDWKGKMKENNRGLHGTQLPKQEKGVQKRSAVPRSAETQSFNHHLGDLTREHIYPSSGDMLMSCTLVDSLVQCPPFQAPYMMRHNLGQMSIASTGGISQPGLIRPQGAMAPPQASCAPPGYHNSNYSRIQAAPVRLGLHASVRPQGSVRPPPGYNLAINSLTSQSHAQSRLQGNSPARFLVPQLQRSNPQQQKQIQNSHLLQQQHQSYAQQQRLHQIVQSQQPLSYRQYQHLDVGIVDNNDAYVQNYDELVAKTSNSAVTVKTAPAVYSRGNKGTAQDKQVTNRNSTSLSGNLSVVQANSDRINNEKGSSLSVNKASVPVNNIIQSPNVTLSVVSNNKETNKCFPQTANNQTGKESHLELLLNANVLPSSHSLPIHVNINNKSNQPSTEKNNEFVNLTPSTSRQSNVENDIVSGQTILTSEWIEDVDLAARIYAAYDLIPSFDIFEKNFIDSVRKKVNRRKGVTSDLSTSESICCPSSELTLIDLTNEPDRLPRIKPKPLCEILDKSLLPVSSHSLVNSNDPKGITDRNLSEVDVTPIVMESQALWTSKDREETLTLYSEKGISNIKEPVSVRSDILILDKHNNENSNMSCDNDSIKVKSNCGPILDTLSNSYKSSKSSSDEKKKKNNHKNRFHMKKQNFDESKYGHLFDIHLHTKKLKKDKKKKTQNVKRHKDMSTSKKKVVPPIKLKIVTESTNSSKQRRSHEVATSSSNDIVTVSGKTSPPKKVYVETCNKNSDSSAFVKMKIDRGSSSPPVSNFTLKTVETLIRNNFSKTSQTCMPLSNGTMNQSLDSESGKNSADTRANDASLNNYTTIHCSSFTTLDNSKDPKTKSKKIESSHSHNGGNINKSSVNSKRLVEIDIFKDKRYKHSSGYYRKKFNIKPCSVKLYRVSLDMLHKYNVPDSQCKEFEYKCIEGSSKKEISFSSNPSSCREVQKDVSATVRRSPENNGDKTENTPVQDPIRTRRMNIDKSSSFIKVSNDKTCSVRERKNSEDNNETLKSSERKRKLSDHRLSCDNDPNTSEENIKKIIISCNTETHSGPSLNRKEDIGCVINQNTLKTIKKKISECDTENSSDVNMKSREELKCVQDKHEVSLENSLESSNILMGDLKLQSKEKSCPDKLKRKSGSKDIEVNLEACNNKKECFRKEDSVKDSKYCNEKGMKSDESIEKVKCPITVATVPSSSQFVIQQISSVFTSHLDSNSVKESRDRPKSDSNDLYNPKTTDSPENATNMVNSKHPYPGSSPTITYFSSHSNSPIGRIDSARSLSTKHLISYTEVVKCPKGVESNFNQGNTPVNLKDKFTDNNASSNKYIPISKPPSNIQRSECNESDSFLNQMDSTKHPHPTSQKLNTNHSNINPLVENDNEGSKQQLLKNNSFYLSDQQPEKNNNTLDKSSEDHSLPSSQESEQFNDLKPDPRLKRLTYCGYDTASLINISNVAKSSFAGGRRSSTEIVAATKRFLAMDLKLSKFDQYQCFKCKEVFTVYDHWNDHFHSSGCN